MKKPKKYDYNLVVIGAGAAGLVSSYIASAVKAKVALIEKHKMGGDCLNTGCVPSKAIIRSAKILSYMKRSEEFGIKKVEAQCDFQDIMERVHHIITKIEPHDSIERYTKLGVDCITGEAEIIDPYHVHVNGRVLTTRSIIIASGASPIIPEIKGLECVEPLTSDTIWDLKSLPQQFVVIGGGVIGCELSQAFARLGSKVSIVQRNDYLLPNEDSIVSEHVKEKLEQDGVTVHTGYMSSEVIIEGSKKYLLCRHKNSDHEIKILFDEILFAVGRKPNIKGMGLENLGVRVNQNGAIQSDAFLRTNYPNIYVCGDISGCYQLTHAAAHQAWYASINALFSPFKKFAADYSIIPYAIFTDPEIARVGLNEKEAQAQGGDYEVTDYGIDDLDRAITDSEAQGFVRVITKKKSDVILGVTIVGYHASDMIAEFVLAMKHKIGLNKILGTIHIYPTMAEANKYVAGSWKRNNAPEALLKWIEAFHRFRRGG